MKSLPMAYAMKKKMNKGGAACMSDGGMVDSKPSMNHADHAASIAHAILASSQGYSEGGEVESLPSSGADEMLALSESGDHFLMDEDGEETGWANGGTIEDKKPKIGSILAKLRMGR